ncbi:MAG: hypothetical protein AABN34_21325 [Acidobacteriota bacterium]
MKEMVDRFVELERKLSAEKGDFALFALFLRDDALDKWDLVVAAPWIESNRKTALDYVTNQIQAVFNPDEITRLSRVVLVDETNPALDAINRAISVQHGIADIQNSVFFGLQIKHGYIITSQKPNGTAEVSATKDSSLPTPV